MHVHSIRVCTHAHYLTHYVLVVAIMAIETHHEIIILNNSCYSVAWRDRDPLLMASFQIIVVMGS